jgi:hypothetical protein
VTFTKVLMSQLNLDCTVSSSVVLLSGDQVSARQHPAVQVAGHTSPMPGTGQAVAGSKMEAT